MPMEPRESSLRLLSIPLIACALGIGAVMGGACSVLGCFSDALPPLLPSPSFVPVSSIQSSPVGSFTPWPSASPPVSWPTFLSPPAFDPLTTVPSSAIPTSVLLDVPFTSQAPTGIWDALHEEACEEASVIMVDAFLAKQTLTRETADKEIKQIIAWEEANGYAMDISTAEIVMIMSGYFDREARVYTGSGVTVDNIKKLLAAGHPVIIPAAGRLLKNPNFTPPGPQYHMLVIVGYDADGFITNDPGTRHGAEYHYSFATVLNAIHDWTGSKTTVAQGQKAMVVVRKPGI